MSVTVKIECQKCEAVHDVELDGVLVLGFKQESESIIYPWFSHDMPQRRAILGFLDYMSKHLKEAAEEGGFNSPEELIMALIEHGKFGIEK